MFICFLTRYWNISSCCCYLLCSEKNKEFSSPYDATAVELLRSSGARIVGKTNCDEFGMGYGLNST